tara:strand:+ start:387 stop:620 length:234 start_codon:yes stop_codon:yes gene_type:complete
MGYVNIIPLITNRKENMQYYILRRIKLWGEWEYDTDPKAKRGYKDMGEVAKKIVALENLNEDKNISYVVVNDHGDNK